MGQVDGVARSQLTRQRIIEATVEMLVSSGFGNATMRAVAARAGASVGAVQYHFPTKQALLIETLTAIFQEVVQRLSMPAPAASSFHERARRIVRNLWTFYGGPRYLAANEIILGLRMEPGADRPILRLRELLTRAYREAWERQIVDSPLPTGQRLMLLQHLFSTLRGMAILSTFERDSDYFEPQLVMLESMVGAVLASGAVPGLPDPGRDGQALAEGQAAPQRHLAVV